MSRANCSKTNLTRRGFVKAGALGSLGLAAAGSMTGCSEWLGSASGSEAEEYVGYTFHQNHCTGHCSLKCTVRDGRLCLIEPNDAFPDPRYRIVCVRGESEIQHVYGAERIQTPLKLVGERGSGEYESITWDEALSIIKERLGSVWETYGKDAVVVAGTSDVKARYPFIKQLFNAQQDGRTGIDVGVGNGLGPMIGDSTSFVIATSEMRDWARAKTVIIASANVLESSISCAKTFFEAQEAGAEIISVDTHFTTTASKADQWIPIEPGTDAALFLGMCSAIIDNKWYDEASMKTGTSFPFLVNSQTGALLRQDMASATSAQTGIENPYMVWNEETGSAVAYTECENPALTGTFTIDGETYITAFDVFCKSQKDNGYTLEWAQKVTSVPAEDIEELAKKYALNTPATLSLGWGGSDKYMNADICGQAAGMLAALTGNYGKEGASVGVHLGAVYTGWSGKLASWPLPTEYAVAKQEMPTYQMRYKENKVHAYVALGDMFQQHYANFNVTKEWLSTLDFILYVDIYHATSADWADIILPACSKFETPEEVEYLKFGYGHLLMQGHVLDPLFESKTDMEIERLLAKTMGVGQGSLPETSKEYCEYQIANSTDSKLEGFTLQKLIDAHGVLPLKGYDTIRQVYDTQVAKTLSGRFDVYLEKRLSYNQAVPAWEECDEIAPDNPLREKYPLQFYQARTKFQIHSMFCDAQWIKLFYEPHIEMNPIDMKERGLNDGDNVEAYNDRGVVGLPVMAMEMVRPGSVRVVEGLWSKYMNKGNVQELTNDNLSPREAILAAGTSTPFQDTLCEIRKA